MGRRVRRTEQRKASRKISAQTILGISCLEPKEKKDNPNSYPEVAVTHQFERTVVGELCDAAEKVDAPELREEMWSIINKHAATAEIEIRDHDLRPLIEKLTSEQREKLHTDLLRLLARSLPRNL
jgi:hypothetical protein